VSNCFFVSKKLIERNKFQLDIQESKHILSVLRLNIGEKILLSDGEGTVYQGLIENIDNKIVRGEILNNFDNLNETLYNLHLGLPLINKNRFKVALEKAVELGVNEITPIRFRRSQPFNLNESKMNSIILAASKQSIRSIFPKLNKIRNLEEWYLNESVNLVAKIDSKHSLLSNRNAILNDYKKFKKISILVGPEGDFSPEEITFFNENNFQDICLGKTILRTETAIISMIAILNEIFINEKH
jgi:16S rRNA (uracil1498-N3)-methyltransferase